MTKRETEEIQNQLLQTKERLEQELSSFASKDPSVEGDWDTKFQRIPEGGLEGAADEVEAYSTNLHIEHSLEERLKSVNAALERVKKGTYGVCESCGKKIAKERLRAVPESAVCVNCR